MTVLDRMLLGPCRSFSHRGSSVGSFSKRKSETQLHPFSAAEQQRRMQEADIDRWSTTTRFRWRKCFSCSCFSAAHLDTCDVCGAAAVLFEETPALPPSKENSTIENSPLREAADDDDRSVALPEQILHAKPLPDQDEQECRSEEREDILVLGVLEESPPVGTLVEVLFEGDGWWPARIVKANGSKATIFYDDGEEDEVELEYHAVRLVTKESTSLKVAEGSDGTSSDERSLSVIPELREEEDYDNDDSECESVCDIQGALDLAPPVGTLIKVLHEDDVWRSASVIEANGSMASILYDNDVRDEINFEVNAVRLLDYISDDEADCDDEEESLVVVGGKTNDDEQHHCFECVENADTIVAKADDGVRDKDSDVVYVELPGLLDEPPVAGAVVMVLHDDMKWWLARIVGTNGLKANVIYEGGEIDEIDFECHPVRPINYMSDEEEDDVHESQ